MHRPLAVLSTLAFASTASASPSIQDALGQEQLQLDERRSVFDDSSDLPYVRYAAFSQISVGGRDGGDIGVGAAGAVSGLGCDALAADVQGRLRPGGDSERASGVGRYSICLSKIGLTAYFDGTRSMGLAPGLGAKRSLWNRRYQSTYDSMGIAFGEIWKEGSPSRHTFTPVRVGHGTTKQEDGLEIRTTKELDLDLALYRYRHTGGLSIEAVTLAVEAMKAGTDNRGAVASAFMPVRVRYEAPDYYVGASVGWGMAGGQVSASGTTEIDGEEVSSWSETIDSEGLPAMTRFAGSLELGFARDRVSVETALSSGFYPTFDGNLARESRVSGSLAYTFGHSRRNQLTLSPFATRTQTWTRQQEMRQDLAAGTTLQLGRQLSNEVRIDAVGAVGVSPYSQLVGDRLPAGSFGGQFVIALSSRLAR